MKQYKLEATLQKSYYGKAVVTEDDNGTRTLCSYSTNVCRIENGQFIRMWDGFSVTTMKHINDFRMANDLEPLDKKTWMRIPTEGASGHRFKVTISNGFCSHTASAIFDSYEQAAAEAARHDDGFRFGFVEAI